MIDTNQLRIDASYSYRTYAGCLEGCPTAKSCIKKARGEAVSLWGERATLLIESDHQIGSSSTMGSYGLDYGPPLSD